jgi:hypothetical protein
MLQRNLFTPITTKHLLSIILFGALFVTLVMPANAGGDHRAWLEAQSFTWGDQDPAGALVRWDRDSGDPVGYRVSAAEMEALRQQFNPRSYTTPPPPLQAFVKFVITDDYMTVLICEYDFWTGERGGCGEFPYAPGL